MNNIVLPALLDRAHKVINLLHHLTHGGQGSRKCNHADAERYRPVALFHGIREERLNLFYNQFSCRKVCLREEYSELVTTQTTYYVKMPDVIFDCLSNFSQSFIAGFMPQGIIDCFEIVQINIGKSERPLISFRTE